jgi:hypothetical protein
MNRATFVLAAIVLFILQGVTDNSISGSKIAEGHVVRSINNLRDNIIIQGAGGASVTTNQD